MYFSIIIPCYNEEGYIKKCLHCLENQTMPFKEFEVIVVDNQSTDNTSIVACEFEKQTKMQMRLLTAVSRGVSNARNRGAEISRGEYLVFLDADNTSDPNLLNSIRCQIVKSGNFAGVIKTLPSSKTALGMGVFILLDRIKKIGPRPFGKNYCAKDLFLKVGGYNNGIALGENVEFLLKVKKCLKRTGKKIDYISTPVYCSMRRFAKEGFLKVLLQWLSGYLGFYGRQYKVIR
ncbi:MAG: glycosyltransferase family 2 protein [Simkaniaceae bacterium]|nr:glycosyltransferase family 2 protein [Simkaniaceae bacterium]